MDLIATDCIAGLVQERRSFAADIRESSVQNGHVSGLVQACGNSIAIAMELPQPCTKPWIYPVHQR